MSITMMSPAGQQRNLRRHPRFSTPPMYHAISVRLLDEDNFGHDGHAYNLSEGGVQFELDDAIEPGTNIAMRVAIPGEGDGDSGRGVFVMGRVIWVEDPDDEPGPARMAMAFNYFPRAADRQRLMKYLNRGVLRLAA